MASEPTLICWDGDSLGGGVVRGLRLKKNFLTIQLHWVKIRQSKRRSDGFS
ncbi:hypothetical protein [Egbenema bharatensis]|uniref:hypothetical protein n=1 Tax=Egbenema bharatensis TaxID=3463334 RepID=UPI003A853633